MSNNNNDEERPGKRRKTGGFLERFFGFNVNQSAEDSSRPQNIPAIPPAPNGLFTTHPAATADRTLATTAASMNQSEQEENSKKRRASVVFREEEAAASHPAAPPRNVLPRSNALASGPKRKKLNGVQLHKFRENLQRNNPNFVLPNPRTPGRRVGAVRRMPTSSRRSREPIPPPSNIREQQQNRMNTATSLLAPPVATTSRLDDIFEEWEELEPNEVKEEQDPNVPESVAIPSPRASSLGHHPTTQPDSTSFQFTSPLTQTSFENGRTKLITYCTTRQDKQVFSTDDQMAHEQAAPKDIWGKWKEDMLSAKWKCPACSVMNDPSRVKCESCETDRPDDTNTAAVDSTVESTTTTAKGSIGKGGFSFAGAGPGGSANPFAQSGAPTSTSQENATTNSSAPLFGGSGNTASTFAFGGSGNTASTFAFGGSGNTASGFAFGGSGNTASASGFGGSRNTASASGFGGSSTQNSSATVTGATNPSTTEPTNANKPGVLVGAPSAGTITKSGFTFGAPATSAAKTEAAEPSAENSKPQLSFGTPATDSKEPKPSAESGTQQAFETTTFGAPATKADPKSAFSSSDNNGVKDKSSDTANVAPIFGNKTDNHGSKSFAAAAPFGARSREDSGAMSLGSEASDSKNDSSKTVTAAKSPAFGTSNFSSASATAAKSTSNGSDGEASKKPINPTFGSSASAITKPDGSVTAPAVPAFGAGSSTGFGETQSSANQSKTPGFASSITGVQDSSKKLEDAADAKNSTASFPNNSNPFGSNTSSGAQVATFGQNASGAIATNPFNGSNGLGGSTLPSSDSSKKSNPFGSGQPSFGSQNNAGTSFSGFGGNAGSFGAPNNSASSTGTFRFGSTLAPTSGNLGGAAPALGGFGSSGGFGGTPAPTPSEGFGGPIKPASSAIGSTSAFPSAPTSAFPSAPTSAFPSAQAPTSAFPSAQATTSAFPAAQAATSAFPSAQATTSAFPAPTSAVPPPSFGGSSAFGNTFPASQFGGGNGQQVQHFGMAQQATAFAPNGSANPASFGQQNGGSNFGGGNTSQQPNFAVGTGTSAPATAISGRRLVKARRPKR